MMPGARRNRHQWRAAERRSKEIPEGSAEWRAIHRDIDTFRQHYQEMFKR